MTLTVSITCERGCVMGAHAKRNRLCGCRAFGVFPILSDTFCVLWKIEVALDTFTFSNRIFLSQLKQNGDAGQRLSGWLLIPIDTRPSQQAGASRELATSQVTTRGDMVTTGGSHEEGQGYCEAGTPPPLTILPCLCR